MKKLEGALVPARPQDFAKRGYVVGATDGLVLGAIACTESTRDQATFVARILNRSVETLFCSIYGEMRRGLESLPPNETRVPAQGLDDITIVVPIRLQRPFQRVVVTMRSATVEYSMDAPVPKWSMTPWMRAAVAGLAALLVLVVVSANMLTIGYVPALVAPQALVQIPYEAYGFGRLAYDIRDTSGRIIASGGLPLGRGTAAFQSGDASNDYRMSLRLHQLFGERSVESAKIAVVVPAPALKPPAILAFEIAKSEVHSGEPIDVRYSVSASAGSVRLLDAAGITVDSVPIGPTGKSTLVSPSVDVASTFRVELVAKRGAGTTTSGTALRILPPDVPQGGGAQSGSGVVALPKLYANAGQPFEVDLVEHRFPISLVLQDVSGRVVARQNPPRQSRSASFDIPIDAQGTYVLIVTVAAGKGQQSFIMRVPIQSQ